MRCPACGAADLIHTTHDIPTDYRGVSAIIPVVTGEFCPACGEAVLDREQGDLYGRMIGQFRHQVDDQNPLS
jgi:HTH-type transcriptional regulator/antitoxin MqsA